MFTIKIADITVQIDNRYALVHRLCERYLVESSEAADLTVSVSEEEIERQLQAADICTTKGYAESVCVYRHICEQIPSLFHAFLFHSAVIEYEGRGYVFAARSGTGKSTHIALWQKHFGENVHVVNGDKPIMRFEGDTLYAYGTPWCGKEGLEINTRVPVTAICFLEQGAINTIRNISPADAVMRAFEQVLAPTDIASVDAMFPLLDQMLMNIPCYLLTCNMEEEAAAVAYQGMKEKGEREKI